MILLSALAMFVGTYYFAAIVQTILHKLFGHHNRIRNVYETHAKGHHRKYPPHRLISDEWLDSEQHVMWYYALPFVPTAVFVWWAFGTALLVAHVAAMVFAIWWHIYLHKQYHLRASSWGRFAWFRRKRELHFVHHREVHTNYAIVEYWVDILLRTRKEPHKQPEQAPLLASPVRAGGPTR